LDKDRTNNLFYQKWLCPHPRAVFLLVHGLGAQSGRWEEAARFFLKKDFSSYALELRGFGDTPGPRGNVDSFDTYFQDIRHLARILRETHPQQKIFLTGESLGGLIAFLFAAKFPQDADGLICLSPAFKSRLKFNVIDYARILAYLAINPRKPLPMPFDSSMCTRDPVLRKKIDADKNEHRLATPRLLANIWWAQMKVPAQTIPMPVLFLLGSDQDQLVDPKEIKKVFGRLRGQENKIIQYPGMSHALSADLGREKVFENITQWADKMIKGESA
jgi:alpha-beta hydrolase superfamily lysophospholipase